MKETEERKKNNISIWIILLVGLLIIGACCVTTYFINREKEDTNAKINIIDNFDTVSGNYIKACALPYDTIEENGVTRDISYNVSYFFGGRHKGKLMLGEIEEELIEIKSNKIIKDISYVTNYNAEYSFDDEEQNNQSKATIYTSTLYVLFEDGTIGKIDTDNIRKKEYNVTEIKEFSNVESFVEVFHGGDSINSGGTPTLYGIDNLGKAHLIAYGMGT